jgi:undecaprenyl-diphosphatase
LLPWLAGWPYAELGGEQRKSFEVALHAGAGCALALVRRRELARELAELDRRRVAVLTLSLVPPVIAGYALRGSIERRLGGPRSIAAGLVAGAGAMAFADAQVERRRGGRAERPCEDAGALDGFALGLAQASALVPGVSRNGATLTAARARGFTRDAAQALSWSAALPVILGASALKGGQLARRGISREERGGLALGAATAFASTLASARMLRGRGGPRGAGLRRAGLGRVGPGRVGPGRVGPLYPYSLYRCLLAALVLRRLRRAQ